MITFRVIQAAGLYRAISLSNTVHLLNISWHLLLWGQWGSCCYLNSSHVTTGVWSSLYSVLHYFLTSLALGFKLWWSSRQRSLLHIKPSPLQRNGSWIESLAIMIELACSPFFCTVSMTSRALSPLVLTLAASTSASFKTPRCRSSSSILSRTGLDARSTKCSRTLRIFSFAGMSSLILGSASSLIPSEDGAGKIIWFNNQWPYFNRDQLEVREFQKT